MVIRYPRDGDPVHIAQKMGGPQGRFGQMWKNSSHQDPIPGLSMPTTICQPSLAYLLVIFKNTQPFLKVIITSFSVEMSFHYQSKC